MRASRMNLVTLREDPSEAEIASHRLLLRGGFLHKSGAGLYLYAPLLKRVVDKVSAIIAGEITATGALEVTMPIMQEQGLWEKSGRWATYQATRTMLTVTDRGGQVFGLAPTAEEVVTDYAASVVKSYKQSAGDLLPAAHQIPRRDPAALRPDAGQGIRHDGRLQLP